MQTIDLGEVPFPNTLGFTLHLSLWARLMILLGFGIRVNVEFTGPTLVRIGSVNGNSSAELHLAWPPEDKLLKTTG